MPKLTLVVPALTILALGSLAGCGDDTPDEASDVETVSCDYPDGGTAARPVDKPPSDAPVEGDVEVTIKTSIGDLQATLDSEATPCTVNSVRSLAEQGFFDDTTCPRLTLPPAGISVLQCGDPTGTKSGGPGYTIADELTGTETYEAGTLAMANTGSANTGGSQFFIVYGPTQLPPTYTVFGTIDAAGVKLVEDAAAEGTKEGGPDGTPKVPVDITSVS